MLIGHQQSVNDHPFYRKQSLLACNRKITPRKKIIDDDEYEREREREREAKTVPRSAFCRINRRIM
jgi:hypothetical protein